MRWDVCPLLLAQPAQPADPCSPPARPSLQTTSTGALCRCPAPMPSSLCRWPSSPAAASLASCPPSGCWWRVSGAGVRPPLPPLLPAVVSVLAAAPIAAASWLSAAAVIILGWPRRPSCSQQAAMQTTAPARAMLWLPLSPELALPVPLLCRWRAGRGEQLCQPAAHLQQHHPVAGHLPARPLLLCGACLLQILTTDAANNFLPLRGAYLLRHTHAGTAFHADLALGGSTASRAAACQPLVSSCAAQLAAAEPAATPGPCSSCRACLLPPHLTSQTALLRAVTTMPTPCHACHSLPPAAVPAAPAGGHSHSNRLLHVLKGRREAVAVAVTHAMLCSNLMAGPQHGAVSQCGGAQLHDARAPPC